MSEHWRYEVWVPAPKILRAEQTRHVLEMAAEHGFVPRKISRFGNAPDYTEEEFKLESIDEAVHILCPEGGYLELGRPDVEDWDTALSMSFSSVEEANNPYKLNGEPKTRVYDEMVMFVDNYRYTHESEMPGRVSLTNDVQLLYYDLCTYFDARYGSVWSNYDYEMIIMDWHEALYGRPAFTAEERVSTVKTSQPLMDGERLDQEVRNNKPPGALFWLQYFSNEYAEHLNISGLVTLGATLIRLPKGVIVSFFEYPWDVDFNVLVDVSRKWRLLNPGSTRF